MEIPGRVHNGVVVLEGGPPLPEGLAVTVRTEFPGVVPRQKTGRRVELPLVKSGEPGSLNLTAERIAEIVDDEDAASGR